MPTSAISTQADPDRLVLFRDAALLTITSGRRAGLGDPAAIQNPFYRLVLKCCCCRGGARDRGDGHRSQAVITGAFSLIRQAVQLGLLPRFEVRYTSETHAARSTSARQPALLIGVVLRCCCSHLERPGVGLRYRRLHHHGGRRHHGLCRDLETLELARGHCGGRDPATRRRRMRFLLRTS